MDQEQAGKVPPPVSLAIVICDAVHRDPGTGKHFLLGCFSTLFASKFPAVHPQMAISIALTNGRGTVPFVFQLVDADEEREPVFKSEGEFEFADPRVIGEIVIVMQNITFPLPGEYRFQLYCNDHFIVERRMAVVQVEGGKGDDEHDH